MEIIVKRKFVFWYLIIKARNGSTLLASETYYSKANATRAARRLGTVLKIPYV